MTFVKQIANSYENGSRYEDYKKYIKEAAMLNSNKCIIKTSCIILPLIKFCSPFTTLNFISDFEILSSRGDISVKKRNFFM